MPIEFDLYDIVEMKKPHPCVHHSKLFRIERMGADIRIKCMGCGNYILMPREQFVTKIRKVVSKEISKN